MEVEVFLGRSLGTAIRRRRQPSPPLLLWQGEIWHQSVELQLPGELLQVADGDTRKKEMSEFCDQCWRQTNTAGLMGSCSHICFTVLPRFSVLIWALLNQCVQDFSEHFHKDFQVPIGSLLLLRSEILRRFSQRLGKRSRSWQRQPSPLAMSPTIGCSRLSSAQFNTCLVDRTFAHW